ncbi:MAG: hypothetical protein GY754_31965 [bacterium]|nr:hypothetical protein [bacterium]
MMPLLETEYIIAQWDDDSSTLEYEWKKFAPSKHYRDALEKILKFTKEKNGSKILADLRKMGTVFINDQKWTEEDWLPRMVTAGVKYFSLVLPMDVISKMAFDEMIESVKVENFELFITDSPEKAKEWLRQVQGTR